MKPIVLIMFLATGISVPALSTINATSTLYCNSAVPELNATPLRQVIPQLNQPQSDSGFRSESFTGTIAAGDTGIAEQNARITQDMTKNNDPVITIDPPGMLIQVTDIYQGCGPPQPFTVGGSNLTSDLILTSWSESGFCDISLSPDGGYSTSITLTPVNGTIESTTIYARNWIYSFEDYISTIDFSSSGIEECYYFITDMLPGNAPVTSIGNISAEPGRTVIIPVTAVDFEHISFANYQIEYNPDVLVFQSVQPEWVINVYDDFINDDIRRLTIGLGSTSDYCWSVADNDTIFSIVFQYNGGATDLTFVDPPGNDFQKCYYLLPNEDPFEDYHNNGAVRELVKTTSLTLCLEGLYNPLSGRMNKAQGPNGDMYQGDTTDILTVKLVQPEYPYAVSYTFENVNLNLDCTVNIQLPDSLDESYYIVISHRNSLETWSTVPVSFSESDIIYDFSIAAGNAYGNNLKLINGKYCIYGGDVNQDGSVDTGDMTPVDNDAASFSTGYIATDVNGDGTADTGDMTIIDNNAATFVGAIYPDILDLPSITTGGISNITQTTVTSSGQVLSQGGSAVTARGICWSTASNPDIDGNHTNDGAGIGGFTSHIFGLTPGTSYFLRAYATNVAGTYYGNELSFTTALVTPGNGTADADSNAYTTIILGTQEWMAQNLKTTRYANGDTIPNVTGNSDWSGLETGAWCWYNNSNQYENPYGKLYNWHAVTDSRNLCPTGWNIPSDGDWTVLTDFLGGANVADGKMKEAGFLHWNAPNTDASNSSGFTGLPGGSRYQTGTFSYMNSYGYWWSSAEKDAATAWCRSLGYNYESVVRINFYKKNGISVRCLRHINPPVILTASISNITGTSAKGGGNILSDGGAPVDLGGICWSTSPNPTTADSHTANGTGTGAFVSNLTGLLQNTLYYVRAYATNSAGTVYGNEVSFTTLPDFVCGSPLTINHLVSGGIAPVNKTVTYGTVDKLPGESSKCWITSNLGSDHQAVTVNDTTEAAAGWYWQFNRIQGYKHDGANLTPRTWVEPINENSDWLAANDPCALELGSGWRIPTYTEWYNTKGANSYWTDWTDWNQAWNSDLKLHAAGHLNHQNGALINRGSRGNYWSSMQSSTGNGWRLQFYESNCILGPDLKSNGYSVRCLRDNTGTGAAYPVITTDSVTNITINSALCGGHIASNGGAAITAYGVCWSTNPGPSINNAHTIDGSGTGSFTSTLSGLSPGTVYYARAYATNIAGTEYGNEKSFTTGFFVTGYGAEDIDGNNYSSVILGTQEWMAGNLNTTRYANGDTIPAVSDNVQWSGLETGALCRYNNNSSFENPYGKLYNWFAANDSLNICPSGWHIPTDSEWSELTEYLGGLTEAGSKMKEAGILHWNAPNADASNSSGLTGLPGGYRYSDGIFNNLGTNGYWWSSDENNASNAWSRSLAYNNGGTIRNSYKKVIGMSVRCLRQQVLPVLSTTDISNIRGTTARGGGHITSEGEAPVTERGVCWSISPNPATSGNHTIDGCGTGSFVSNMTSLTPETNYFVRAYATNSTGTQYGNEVSFTTLPDFNCGSPITINHIAGVVAPVNKTVTYGTVGNLSGESSKCWITSNLGADYQPTSVNDPTEAAAGWYWQFNHKQGYKHDGTIRTPNTTWIEPIDENLEWQPANDPCALELGNGWRIPTYTEWLNVDAAGNWSNWNGPWNCGLKLHAAGLIIYNGGLLEYRGIYGRNWSSTQLSNSIGGSISFYSGLSEVSGATKTYGFPLRCIRTPVSTRK